MWHWQFLFILNFVSVSWCSAKVTYVFVDSSEEQCKGCISDVAVNQSSPHFIIGDNSTHFSCLKDCVLQRAKIALYRPGGNCFCINDTYIEQGLQINNTCCFESGEESLRNQTLKVFNLTGIILRLQFNEFVELDKNATVEREILLCDKGEFVKNRTTLQRFVTSHTCTIYPRRISILTGQSENKLINVSCFANLTFKNLGENTICIGVRNPVNHACGNVQVLAPVKILVAREIFTLPHLPGESVFRLIVNGTVFRLSYKFGDQSRATVLEFPESNIYDICGVNLIIKYNRTTFAEIYLAVNASNRLGEVNKSFPIMKKRVGFAISNIKSVDGERNRFSLVINVVHPPVRGNVTYKWYLLRSFNKKVKISQNETSVSQVTVTYVMDNDTIHCAIGVRVFKDGIQAYTKRHRLFQGFVRILSPAEYIRTNQPATFRLLHLPGIVLQPIWKINGKEYSRNMTFTYIFDTAGRYSISVISVKNLMDTSIQNVQVIVQDEISLLTLQASSSRIVGRSVTFHAFANSSLDGVNYHWEFGDGRNEITSDSTTRHTYKEKGVYEVKVIAENELSRKSASINVTVSVLCPEYDVETSFQNEKEVNVSRSRAIHLQVGMKSLRCEEPVTVKYIWKISRLDKPAVWNNVSLENHDVNKTTFGIHIPPNVLEYKKYRFRVTVTVSVIGDPERSYFEELTTTINIISTPLKVVIRGGFARYISNVTSFIIMDASMSVDPDDPESVLQFSWTCKSKPLNSPCFKSKDLVQYAGAITTAIPVSELKENGSPYVFDVIVSVSGNELKTGRTFQLMFIDADIYNDILLDCPSCNEGYLNPSKPIVVVRKCVNCVSTGKLSWKFFQLGVTGGDQTEFEKTKCTKPNWVEYGQAKSANFPYVTCQSSTASARINHVKDAICLNSFFSGKVCHVNNLGERDLPTEHVRDRLNSSVLVINKNILPRDEVILLESNDEAYNILAMRYFLVHDGPPLLACKLSPIMGVELHQNFNLTCAPHKSGPLMYKVVFTRENDDGTKMSPIILQGSISSLTFQLPSGYNNAVKYSLTFSIENEMGVSREYCAINVNVLAFNPVPNVTIEEFLYNRSVAAKELFHGHTYAYYSLSLHNVTIIADVLNRQPKTSIKTSIFHLRTQTRMHLLDILSRIEVVGEFVTRQFANALESCTRVLEELNSVSAVTAVETLNRMLVANKHLFEERTEIPDDTRNSIVAVAVRLLKKTAPLKGKKYELKIVEALQHLFKAILRGKIVSGEWINITDHSLNATLMKFSPYRDVNLSLTCGDTNVTFLWKGKKPLTRPYYCDIYGKGIQALTFHTDTFRENNTYQHSVSPLTKINVCDCKRIKHDVGVEIKFPKRKFKTTVWKQMENYSITPSERHSFVPNRSDNSAFKIKLITMHSTSQKSKLRLNVSCFDRKEYHGPPFSTVAHRYLFTKNFFWKEFSNCNGKVNVVIGIDWDIPPSRTEKVDTVVNYTVVMTWTSCLSWDKNSKQWSEKNCKPKGFSSHYIDCRCSKIASDFIAVSKTPLYVLEKIAIPRETNNVMVIVVLVIFLSSVVAIIALYHLEKRERIRQRSFIFLRPSDACHTHQYQITVYTGYGFGAGSTAKVALVLYGENNSSYPVELSIENHKLWKRNSRDIFVVSVRNNLGPLTRIHLWHDNSGVSPSWFIEKLIIKDLASEEKWMFNCRRWLAVDKDDKKLDCRIKTYKGKRKVSFKEFRFELGKKLMDIHVWLSLVGMPSYSLFRRTERLACCVLMVFGYFFFNAFFCQMSGDALIMDCISLFNPSRQMLEIGFISALAVIPIFLFFTVMFRFTLPTQTKKVAPFNTFPNNDQTVKTHGEDNLSPSLERCAVALNELRNKKRRKWSDKVVEAAGCILEDIFEELDYPVSAGNEELIRDIDTTIDSNSIVSNLGVVPDPLTYDSTFNPEITSQGSGSYMHFRNSEKFRFPACYRVLIWIGCIATSVVAAYLAVRLTNRFDMPTLTCYAQSVLWSFLFSFCVFQPFQALVVSVVGVLQEYFVFHVSAIDDPITESGGTPVVLSDYMPTSSTERNFENPAYKKSLYLKYLQPVSKNKLSRARFKLKQWNQEFETIRDLLMYSFLLILSFLMTNHQSVFLYNQGLNHVFTGQANTSSLLTWWSSSPRKILDTLEFSNLNKTISALHGRVIVVGNPKVVMTIKFCKNVSKKEMNYDNRRCLVHEEEKVIIFEKSQKTNWITGSDFVYKQLTHHVKAVSLDFVLYSPSLNVFSAIKLSSQVLLASALQTNFVVKTFQFCVNGLNGNILHTIYQILFTMVPIVLVIRLVFSSAQKTKMGFNVCFQIELSILILSLISFVVMWLWIKSQYSALALLRDASYEADLMKSAHTICDYQECLMLFLGLLQFFVFLKVFDLVGVGNLLSYYVVTLSKLLKLVLMPLFMLILLLTAFAHIGVLLFGDYLQSFSTFLKALSLNVIYLRDINTENLFLENRNDHVILALYVIGFCVAMGITSCLVKAAFCQAHLYCLLTVNKKLSMKAMVTKVSKRIRLFVRHYFNKRAQQGQVHVPVVPMHYIFKEVNEQLDDILFRLVNLFTRENMPPKIVAHSASSLPQYSDGQVEYVHTAKDHIQLLHLPNLSHEVLRSPAASSLESNFVENTAKTKIGNCDEITIEPLPNRVQDETLEEPSVSKAETNLAVSSRYRPFRNAMLAFAKPIDEQMKQCGQPQLCLDDFTEETAAQDRGQEELIRDFERPQKSTEGKTNTAHSRKFRQPDFPVPVDVHLARSTATACVRTNFDISDLEITDIF